MRDSNPRPLARHASREPSTWSTGIPPVSVRPWRVVASIPPTSAQPSMALRRVTLRIAQSSPVGTNRPRGRWLRSWLRRRPSTGAPDHAQVPATSDHGHGPTDVRWPTQSRTRPSRHPAFGANRTLRSRRAFWDAVRFAVEQRVTPNRSRRMEVVRRLTLAPREASWTGRGRANETH